MSEGTSPRRDRPAIQGDFSDDEVLLLTALAEDAGESVLTINRRENGSVEIRTGTLINPKFGWGKILYVEMVDGHWRVTRTSGWMA